MSRETLIRAGLAAGLLAGAAGVALPGVSLLEHGLGSGNSGTLAEGLAFGAGAVALAVPAIFAALADRRRRRAGISVLALATETGLMWLALDFAARQQTGPTWIAGVLALVVSGLAILTWLASAEDIGEDETFVSPLHVLAEVNLGLLAVHYAGDHNPAVAWVLAGLAIAESLAWMVLPEANSSSSRVPQWLLWTFWAVLPVGGTVGAVVVFAAAGNAITASVSGGLGAAVVLYLAFRSDLLSIRLSKIRLSKIRLSKIRLPSGSMARASPPGAVIPAYARVGGLIIPLGTAVWLELTRPHLAGARTAAGFAGVAGVLIGGAICLLILQWLVTSYLRPVSYPWILTRAADSARPAESVSAGNMYGPERYEYERERYAREAERLRRDRGRELEDEFLRPGLLDMDTHPGERQERYRYERARYLNGRERLRRERRRELERIFELGSPDVRRLCERELYLLENEEAEERRRERSSTWDDLPIAARRERESLAEERRMADDFRRYMRAYGSSPSGDQPGSMLNEREWLGEAQRARASGTAASTSLVRRVLRPMTLPPTALRAGIDMAGSTGLIIDYAWPNIQMVAPPDLRADLTRRERSIAVYRAAAASALSTAVAWPLSVQFLGGGASGGVLAVLTAAPFACMVAAIMAARARLAEVYLRRIRATDVYRFDLVKAMRLPLPKDEHEFAALARYINSDSPEAFSDRRPIVWADHSQPDTGTQPGATPDLEELRQTLAAEVVRQAEERIGSLLQAQGDVLRRENASFLDQQRVLFRDWLARQAFGPDEMATLAKGIAERAAGPVSKDLNRRLAQAQQELAANLHASVREVVDSSFTGPPLTNFTGYLTLELQRSSEEHPLVSASGGTIKTGLAHELALDMSVVRHQNAARVASLSRGPGDSFLVLEPFAIEGGRDASAAEFDLVADCSTLTPLPRRNSLTITDKGSTSFRFKLPDQEGKHELWFQLYQAGRLIQVVSIAVETDAGGTADG